MRKKRVPSALRTVTCAICGASFQTRHSQGKYCSTTCTRFGERKSWNKYGTKNAEVRDEYHRNNYRKHRDAVITRTNHYRKTAAGKAAVRLAYLHQKAKHPERVAARQALGVAVRKGQILKRPCERCGAKKVHGHHPDYSRPLDVVWLCPDCHRKEHEAMKNRQIIADNQEEEGMEVTA